MNEKISLEEIGNRIKDNYLIEEIGDPRDPYKSLELFDELIERQDDELARGYVSDYREGSYHNKRK